MSDMTEKEFKGYLRAALDTGKLDRFENAEVRVDFDTHEAISDYLFYYETKSYYTMCGRKFHILSNSKEIYMKIYGGYCPSLILTVNQDGEIIYE